jgi:hypothetical protein
MVRGKALANCKEVSAAMQNGNMVFNSSSVRQSAVDLVTRTSVPVNILENEYFRKLLENFAISFQSTNVFPHFGMAPIKTSILELTTGATLLFKEMIKNEWIACCSDG